MNSVKVRGPMTEETPFNPTSRKGEVRARIAATLLEEMRGGGLQALIAHNVKTWDYVRHGIDGPDGFGWRMHFRRRGQSVPASRS